MADGVIGQGREPEVLALFRPYRLGHEVSGGFKLWNVTIEPRAIVVELRRDQSAMFVKLLPLDPGSRERTKSFSIARESPSPEASAAADALVAAVGNNDPGDFWRPPETGVRRHSSAHIPRERARGIVWPLALTAFFAALLVVIGRRRALTSRPEMARKPPSA